MDTQLKEFVRNLVDMDHDMDVWDGPPSLQAIWRDETGVLANTDLGIPDGMWDNMPPAFIIYQLTSMLSGSFPIPEGVGMAILDPRELVGVCLFTEAWGLAVDPSKGEDLDSVRGDIRDLSEHPLGFEFKTSLTVDSSASVYTYQRTRKLGHPSDHNESENDHAGKVADGLAGPLPYSLQAFMTLFMYAKERGRLVHSDHTFPMEMEDPDE